MNKPEKSKKTDITKEEQENNSESNDSLLIVSCESSAGFFCEEEPSSKILTSAQNDTTNNVLQANSTQTIKTGDMFLHYEIEKELGSGGMGVVYKVRDTKLNRLAALKLVLPGPGVGETEIKRFLQEAKATEVLDHANVVKFYEAGNIPQNYFTMEYISGKTLKDLNREQLKAKELANIFQKIAKALHTAHQQNIIHRDIKPGNIMLNEHQEPKLMDFGLAKITNIETSFSKTGQVMGTLAYMSPEQIGGAELDGRADMYSLGATLYYVLTTRPPFQGENYLDIARQIKKEPIAPRVLNSNIPVKLEAICLKTLEKNPKKRYKDCLALAQDLQSFIADKPIVAKSPTKFTYLKKFILRNKLVVSLLLLLAFSILGGTIIYIHSIQQEQIKTEKARKQALENFARAQQEYKRAKEEKEAADIERKRAKKEQEKKEKAQKLAQDNFLQAEKERKRALEERKKAMANASLAKKQRRLAESAKRKKLLEARKAKIKLAKIALTKANKAYWSNKNWPETGVFAGAALEFIKKLQGTDIDILRNKGMNLIARAQKNYGLIWQIPFYYHQQVSHMIINSKTNQMVTASKDHSIRFWGMATGEQNQIFTKNKSAIRLLALHKNGRFVAIVDNSKNIKFWEIRGSKNITKKHSKSIKFIRFHPFEKYLAYALENRVVVWDIDNDKETSINLPSQITCIKFHPNGKWLAMALKDKTIRFWNFTKKKSFQIHLPAMVIALDFSPKKILACSLQDKTIIFLDIAQRKVIRILRGNSASIHINKFSSSGKFLLSASNRKIKLWHSKSGKVIKKFTTSSAIVAIDFMDSYKKVIFLLKNGQVKILDMGTKRLLYKITGHKDKVSFLAFHPQGKFLASAAVDTTVKIWDIATAKLQKTLYAHKTAVTALAFSTDGKLLASADDKEIIIWDFKRGRFLYKLKGHSSKITSLAFAPASNNAILASGSDDTTVILWDLKNKVLLRKLKKHTTRVNSVSFSFDGTSLVSASDDNIMVVWDKNGNEKKVLFGSFALFVPSGNIIASYHDSSIKLWSPYFRRLTSFDAHTSIVTSMSVNFNGTIFASVSGGKFTRDKKVRVWDFNKQKQIKNFGEHFLPTNYVTLAPNGRIVVSASDNNIKLWRVGSYNFEKTFVPNWVRLRFKNHKKILQQNWLTFALQKEPRLTTQKFFGLKVTPTLSIEPFYIVKLWE